MFEAEEHPSCSEKMEGQRMKPLCPGSRGQLVTLGPLLSSSCAVSASPLTFFPHEVCHHEGGSNIHVTQLPGKGPYNLKV